MDHSSSPNRDREELRAASKRPLWTINEPPATRGGRLTRRLQILTGLKRASGRSHDGNLGAARRELRFTLHLTADRAIFALSAKTCMRVSSPRNAYELRPRH